MRPERVRPDTVPEATASLATIGAHGWSLSGFDGSLGSDGYTWTPTSRTLEVPNEQLGVSLLYLGSPLKRAVL